MSQYTHLCTHTLGLQLQTTSKENAGVQKNVVSLITRNRITVCKSVYIHVPTLRNVMFVYLLHSEILVVNICTSLLPPFTHTHPHTLHTHTCTHATHTTRYTHYTRYTHTHAHTLHTLHAPFQQKLGIYGKGKCSETVTRSKCSVCYCETGEEGGEEGLHAVLVTLGCQLNQFSHPLLTGKALGEIKVRAWYCVVDSMMATHTRLYRVTHTGSQPLCHSARPKACSQYFQCTAASEELPTKSCHFSSTQECTTTLWDEQGRTFMVRKQL